MSRRVFYIVHLDKGRILSLAVLGSGLLLTAFATGYRLAGPGNLPSILPVTGKDPSGTHPAPQAPGLEEKAEPEQDRSRQESRGEEGKAPPSTAEENKSPPASTNTRSTPEKRVNLLESALPEAPTDRDLKVYRKKYADADSLDEKQSKEKKTEKKHHRQTDKKEKLKKTRKSDPSSKHSTRKKETEAAASKENTGNEGGQEQATPKKDLYVLQMGAYQSRSAALRLAEEVRKHGVPVYVRKTGKVHTVRTESTGDRDELLQLEKKLRGLNFSPVSVRLKSP